MDSTLREVAKHRIFLVWDPTFFAKNIFLGRRKRQNTNITLITAVWPSEVSSFEL